MATERIVSWLSFCCPHAPFHVKEAIDWVCERIEELKPDVVVHKGDGHEADAASKFENEQNHTLAEEFRQHNDEILKRIRLSHEKRKKSAPPTRRIFLLGNHDANILAAGRISKKVRSLCDFRNIEPELINKHWEMPCEYEYSQRGVFRLGQVAFCHGYETGVSGDEMQAIILNQKHPYSLMVAGHSHRPVHVTRAYKTKGVPLPFWYCNTGTLGPLKPNYMERKRSHMWGHALAHGTTPLINSPRTKPHWTAQVEILKMGDDE